MKRKILLLSLLSLLQFVFVHFVLIQGFPNSGDEQAFLYQARLYASGRLYVDDPIYDRANPLHKFVAADAMDDTGGRRFSKYDPGWPALLALGAKLRAEWLVAPLLGALTVFLLLAQVRKRIGDQFVAPAWWLVTLCSFFSYSAANFGSHTATMVFVLAAFVLYDFTLGQEQSGRFRWQLLGVGLLLGYCSLIRYLDWIPMMGWVAFDLLRRRNIKGLILVLLGFGVLGAVHFVYNKLLTGNPLIPPAMHDARGNLQARIGISWWGFWITGKRLWRVLYTFPPLLLLLLALWRRCQSTRLKIYLTLFALEVTTYFVYAWSAAGPGPRYFFPYFPFLILAVVEAHRLTRDDRPGRMGWRMALASLVLCSLIYGADQTREIYQRRDLERAVAAIPETKRIILLQTGTYEMDIPDLVRNPADLQSADTLYFAAKDTTGVTELLKRFPGHLVYVYRYPSSLTPWSG
ncbi:MAG: hypothetical protein M3N12_01180 [Verrucomicrobiota bacterium]|nr:hypothetical protein [Verrucomicrobiota bacterium]